jgi:hypothetical protein
MAKKKSEMHTKEEWEKLYTQDKTGNALMTERQFRAKANQDKIFGFMKRIGNNAANGLGLTQQGGGKGIDLGSAISKIGQNAAMSTGLGQTQTRQSKPRKKKSAKQE